jgi:DNA replication protein DnaC
MLASRRKAARFPTGKTFAALDPAVSSIPAPTQQALRTLEWVHRRENLVVCGPPGTGKTFFLEALGQAVVETDRRVVCAAEGLYRIVDAAYEKRSIALSSNLHPALATATVDRLLHHAHISQTSGDSIRLNPSPRRQGVMPLH